MAAQLRETMHQPDQLIVDLQHLPLVETMLRDLGISRSQQFDEDENLGLARLYDLTDATGAAIEVDDILGLLRQRAAADRDGLMLTLGKNRVVDAVIGEGHKPMIFSIAGHKPMSGAAPDPVDPADVPPGVASPDAGRGVRVGVVDTPLPTAGAGGTPIPFRAGHSTFVSSLISRQAPGAEICLEGILADDTARADSWDIAVGMLRLATEQHIDILNLSLGCYTLSGGPPLVITRAIERLSPGVLVVAAAGNHGALAQLVGGRTNRSASWPAACVQVVSVGAMDAGGELAEWSRVGPSWMTCMAPGVHVVGSYLDGDVELPGGVRHFTGHARWSGTSFATATVTGAIAARTRPGSVTPRQALCSLLAENALVRPVGTTAMIPPCATTPR